MFHSRKNEFPFLPNQDHRGLYTASPHSPVIQRDFRLPPSFSRAAPIPSPNLSSSTRLVENAAGQRGGGRRPDNQAVTSGTRKFCSTQVCFSSHNPIKYIEIEIEKQELKAPSYQIHQLGGKQTKTSKKVASFLIKIKNVPCFSELYIYKKRNQPAVITQARMAIRTPHYKTLWAY